MKWDFFSSLYFSLFVVVVIVVVVVAFIFSSLFAIHLSSLKNISSPVKHFVKKEERKLYTKNNLPSFCLCSIR